MISSQKLSIISRRLNEITGNDQAFGGLNNILWHLFKPALLKENKRQCQDNSFVRLLIRARIGALLPQD